MLKNKKLLLTLLMLFVIAVVATACGSDNNNADNGNNVENNDNGNNNGGETTASGEDVYKDECLSCHGDEGEGASGPKLQGDDFASDVDSVVEQVEEGGGDMPSFKDQLSDDEIQAVSEYVSDELANK